MIRKKLALGLLAVGLGCLAGYLLLLFYADAPALTVVTLVLSIACNSAAVNLFLSAKSGRKDEDDA